MILFYYNNQINNKHMDGILEDVNSWITNGGCVYVQCSCENLCSDFLCTQNMQKNICELCDENVIHCCGTANYLSVKITIKNSKFNNIIFRNPCIMQYFNTITITNECIIKQGIIEKKMSNDEEVYDYVKKYLFDSIYDDCLKYKPTYFDRMPRFLCLKKLFDDLHKNDEIVIEI